MSGTLPARISRSALILPAFRRGVVATVSKEDMKRLADLYADRLTRNARYKADDMTELTGSEVWWEASDEHRRFLKQQLRNQGLKLLLDAGFPAEIIRRIKEGR